MASSGIPTSGEVSVGSTSGITRSINALMTIAANTADTSLGQREINYMVNLLNYGVCMPNQVQKNAVWGPTGSGGTYRPTAFSEFRGSYRWPNIVSGNTISITFVRGSTGPGNGQLICDGQGSPAYISSSTPYFMKNGSGGSWIQASANNGTRVTFSSLMPGTYNIYIKDWEGCGSATNLFVSRAVTYP